MLFCSRLLSRDRILYLSHTPQVLHQVSYKALFSVHKMVSLLRSLRRTTCADSFPNITSIYRKRLTAASNYRRTQPEVDGRLATGNFTDAANMLTVLPSPSLFCFYTQDKLHVDVMHSSQEKGWSPSLEKRCTTQRTDTHVVTRAQGATFKSIQFRYDSIFKFSNICTGLV